MYKPRRMLRGACIVLLGILVLVVGMPATTVFAARKDCSTETDNGRRMKCEMENLTDAFDGVVTTALSDNTGAFSEEQMQALRNLRSQSKRETGRIEPEYFKQTSKKRKVECYPQEILGDVKAEDDLNGNNECDNDLNEICIGDEDGVCDLEEYHAGGCAELLGDGIGDDDGICEFKGGRYDEVCVEICDTEIILAEGEESNIAPGRAQELERSLADATDLIDEANVRLARYVAARAVTVPTTLAVCDKEAMTPCEYLQCLIESGRLSSSETIETLSTVAVSLQGAADTFRDLGDQTIPIPFIGGSIDARIVALPLGLAANGVQIIANMVEVVDDSETAERVDAMARCVSQSHGEIQAIDTMTETAIELLNQAYGQRPGFPSR